MLVRVHFVDGNAVWSDEGVLRRHRSRPGFVLELRDDQGTRVFPLAGRQAEVYRLVDGVADYDSDPLIQTCNDKVLLNTWSTQ